MSKELSKSKIKKSLENINFDILAKDICDPAIITDKFFHVYNNLKQYIVSLSYLFNSIQEGITKSGKKPKFALNSIRNFIETSKKELYIYKSLYDSLKGKQNISEKDVLKIEEQYKLMCKGEIINNIMFSYKRFIIKEELITQDGSWIQSSNSRIEIFKGIKVSLFQLYNIDKVVVSDKIFRVYTECKKFYDKYTSPNFNMDSAIDSICTLLEKLNRKHVVKCDRIPVYMRRVHSAGIINVEEMNMTYLETDNKSTFVLSLMENLMKVKSDTIKIDIRTSMQMRNLLNYVNKTHNSPKLASTLKAGTSLLNNVIGNQ